VVDDKLNRKRGFTGTKDTNDSRSTGEEQPQRRQKPNAETHTAESNGVATKGYTSVNIKNVLFLTN